jgi:DNA-binding response OmpR family regulator
MVEAVAPLDGSRPSAQAGKTVLLVEDEPSVRQLLVMSLKAHGYAVIEAGEGNDALDLLEGTPHLDLLITDLGLASGFTGRQLAEAARALRPGLKVLFITGYAGPAAAGSSPLETGMELMTKPFTMAAFSTRVRAMIRYT